jgi:hypothetical protein
MAAMKMDRAFSSHVVRVRIPRALPQAAIKRAVGAYSEGVALRAIRFAIGSLPKPRHRMEFSRALSGRRAFLLAAEAVLF